MELSEERALVMREGRRSRAGEGLSEEAAERASRSRREDSICSGFRRWESRREGCGVSRWACSMFDRASLAGCGGRAMIYEGAHEAGRGLARGGGGGCGCCSWAPRELV